MTTVEQAIQQALVDGHLPCATAFTVAESLQVKPAEVGQAADRLDVRLSQCQLGLFGYGRKAEGKHRRVRAVQDITPEMAAAIRASLGEDGKLSCAAAWRIAAEFEVARQAVADAAEGLGLRIARCQLGAF
jgi:hypothetical protein